MASASAWNDRACAWNVGSGLTAYCQAVVSSASIHPLYSGIECRTKPWSCRRRALPTHLVHYYVDGVTSFACGGERHRMVAGTCLWLPAGLPHDLAVSGRRTLFRLRFDLPPAEAAPPTRPQILHGAAHLRPLVEAIDAELRMPGALSGFRLRCLLGLLLSHIGAGPTCEDRSGRGLGLLRAGDRRRLERFVAAAQHPWPEPCDLARLLDLSPGWFARAFRRSYGCSPRRWLADRRIRAAADLLAWEGCTVAEAAARLGFAHQGQFTRRFRAVFGLTPTAWLATEGA